MIMTHGDSDDTTRTNRMQARTWAQIARLAGDAIDRLAGGKIKDALAMLTAIRGVALNADMSEAAATSALPAVLAPLQSVAASR